MLRRILASMILLLGLGLSACNQAGTPTPTRLPGITAPPQGQYLLVVYDKVVQPSKPIMIDFPTYSISEKDRQLLGNIPALGANDIGYVGTQTRMQSPGGGMASQLKVVSALPYEIESGLRIVAMHADGSITIERQSGETVIGMGKSLDLGQVKAEEGSANLTLYNYGFMPRDKITPGRS